MKTVSLLFGLVLHFAACAQNHEVRSLNHRADSIAIAFNGASLKSPEELALKMVAGVSSNEEKFRIIFRWITDNISYDIKTYNHIRRLTKKYGPNSLALKKYNRYLGRTWYTRVKGKKLALCSGYSGILERMCEARRRFMCDDPGLHQGLAYVWANSIGSCMELGVPGRQVVPLRCDLGEFEVQREFRNHGKGV